MKPQTLPFLRAALLLAIAVVPAGFAAEAANAGENNLRAALRDATLQLRTVHAERDALLAAQTAQAEEKKSLNAKVDALTKQVVADKSASDRNLAAQSTQLAEQKAAAAKLSDTLEKTRAEGEKAAQAARAAETENAKLTQENNLLLRRASDLEARNLALFKLGNEILSKYEDFSLGKALMAKEPFVSRTRVRLENLVQDYADKLIDQRAPAAAP